MKKQDQDGEAEAKRVKAKAKVMNVQGQGHRIWPRSQGKGHGLTINNDPI